MRGAIHHGRGFRGKNYVALNKCDNCSLFMLCILGDAHVQSKIISVAKQEGQRPNDYIYVSIIENAQAIHRARYIFHHHSF